MAIVRYCIINTGAPVGLCTAVISWDDANTYYPPSGSVVAGDNTGEVGQSYNNGSSPGGLWSPAIAPSYSGGDVVGPLPIVDGGTGASDAPTALTNLGAAASGAVKNSGLTQATGKILGRTTASTGAIEELSVGGGFGLASTQLSLNGPAFRAYVGTNQTIASSTITKVAFNTEVFDTNSNYDPTTNYRFTPTVEGYYSVTANIRASGTGGIFFGPLLYKNGTRHSDGTTRSDASADQLNTVTCLIYMNGSTDYLECYFSGTTSSGSITITAGIQANRFFAHFVRGP